MFSMAQIVAHLVGDYILQNHWIAINKTTNSWIALLHALLYTLPFLFLTRSPVSLFIICFSHFFIDRFGIGRKLVWFKNQLAPKSQRFSYNESGTGFPKDTPIWLAVWLMIICDNILHIVINGLALM